MAVKTEKKRTIEVLLVAANINGAGFQKILAKSRNLLTVDLVWPRASIARKSVAREARFVKSFADFTSEEWAKRILFREDVEGHTALAVSISENLNDEFIEKFLRTAAKYAFRTASDLVDKVTTGISDIATAPLDAISAIVGSYPGPKSIAQGVIDVNKLPAVGKEYIIDIPLHKPDSEKIVGTLKVLLRG